MKVRILKAVTTRSPAPGGEEQLEVSQIEFGPLISGEKPLPVIAVVRGVRPKTQPALFQIKCLLRWPTAVKLPTSQQRSEIF
jgi:hypothetical protein